MAMAMDEIIAKRTLKIVTADSLSTFDVAVLDGVEPAALRAAVAARAGVPELGFFLTASNERAAAVVPLSAVLRDGTTLVRNETSTFEPPCIAYITPVRGSVRIDGVFVEGATASDALNANKTGGRRDFLAFFVVDQRHPLQSSANRPGHYAARVPRQPVLSRRQRGRLQQDAIESRRAPATSVPFLRQARCRQQLHTRPC